MSSVPMRHMMILIPGIMGSVLQTPDGHDLWALSGQALGRFILTRGTVLNQLALPAGDNICKPLAPDGVRATRLIENLYAIPGFIEGAGYNDIHRYIKATFNVVEGDIARPQDNANYYPFPYDWRRDLRAAAYTLKNFIDRQLPIWRKKFGGKDAQLILLGHSMGGLVARYYLDVLGGWENTLVTLTFGTPHRGSVNALDMLSNGIQIRCGSVKRSILSVVDKTFSGLFGKLTTAVRSFPSAYQLMPRYPMLQIDGKWVRIAEVPSSVGIPNLDLARAAAAYKDLYLEIDKAFKQNRQNSSYTFTIMPVIGTRQPTLQSARLQNGAIVPGFDPPPDLDPLLATGDGTVPQGSALPVEMADNSVGQRFFISERHSWLPNNNVVREEMLDQLITLVAKTTKNLRGSEDNVRPVLSLDLDPLYLAGEKIVLDFSAAPARSETGLEQPAITLDLNVQVKRIDGTAQVVKQQVVRAGVGQQRGSLVLVDVAPGLYLVHTHTITTGQRSVGLNGVFEVMSESATV